MLSKVLLFLLFTASCTSTKLNYENKEANNKEEKVIDFVKDKNVTFIFAFNDVIYDSQNNRLSYIDILHKKTIDSNKKKYSKLEQQINNFVANNFFLTKTKQGTVDLRKMLKARFHITFTEQNIIDTVNELQNIKFNNIDVLIKNLIASGYDVKIIGGSIYGCAIIAPLVKDFNVKEEDVYSGYGKTLQDNEVVNIWTEEWRYANCKNLKEKTPYSEDKKDIIKYIKDNHKLKNSKNKIVMIEGVNNLYSQKNYKKTTDYLIILGDSGKIPNNKLLNDKSLIFADNIDHLIDKIKILLEEVE